MAPSAAIYIIAEDLRASDHVELALTRLRAAVDRLIVVASAPARRRHAAAIAAHGADAVIELPPPARPATRSALRPADRSVDRPLLGFYRAGCLALRDLAGGDIAALGPAILTGAQVLGPLEGRLGDLAALDGAKRLRAGWWHGIDLDPRMADIPGLPRMPVLDIVHLSAEAMRDPAFWAYWDGLVPGWDARADLAGFARACEGAGIEIGYWLPDAAGESAEPAIFEVHRLLPHGVPALPLDVLRLDPVRHDLGAIRLRDALDELRRADPALHAAAIRFAGRHLTPRDFAMIADQYAILPETPRTDPDRPRAFGTIAVFIHAFYAAMMPEFAALIDRLPADRHLFVTTATGEDRAAIEAFLAERGDGPDTATVRVVEQNRGRDMASLFITWRDVVLSGDYAVALRLHSKRTPQVSRQVGESFKDHLFDNLVGSKGYVSNLLDRMEAEPDIGLVIPPIIHVGFGTLGHAWFANRAPLQRLCDRIGIDVPLDDSTPLAPNGTMYWFRTDALRLMFETEWRWEDYNAEPHHIDGGLAHVQERLIGYAVIERGYRILQVMAPAAAARNYAKLEWKMQMLASYLSTGNIHQQRLQMEAIGGGLRTRLYRRLLEGYGRLLIRHPGARAHLRAPARIVGNLLAPGRDGDR